MTATFKQNMSSLLGCSSPWSSGNIHRISVDNKKCYGIDHLGLPILKVLQGEQNEVDDRVLFARLFFYFSCPGIIVAIHVSKSPGARHDDRIPRGERRQMGHDQTQWHQSMLTGVLPLSPTTDTPATLVHKSGP